MELESGSLCGATRGERSPERLNQHRMHTTVDFRAVVSRSAERQRGGRPPATPAAG
jgi:hypothetical protein